MVSWKARYLWRHPWIQSTPISMEPSTDSTNIANDLKAMRKVSPVLFYLNSGIISQHMISQFRLRNKVACQDIFLQEWWFRRWVTCEDIHRFTWLQSLWSHPWIPEPVQTLWRCPSIAKSMEVSTNSHTFKICKAIHRFQKLYNILVGIHGFTW
jgi:hypothetical protein